MKLIAVQTAAKLLDVGTATVRRWCDEGLLPAFALTDKNQRLFDPAVVERLRAQRDRDRSERASRG